MRDISLRNDPVAAGVATLAAVTIAGWGFLAWSVLPSGESVMRLMMPASAAWSATNAVMVFIMWAIMMAAMMTPGAAPMVLVYARVIRRDGAPSPRLRMGLFLGGYLVVWTGFSLLAAGLQWAFQSAVLTSPMIASQSVHLSSAILIAAGVYQWTPLKQACLRHCRSPVGFVMSEWRTGTRGAAIMGLKHGTFCVGCCWVLMALLFVAGVMNLAFVAVIAAAVLIEKIAPAGGIIARGFGAILTLGGVLLWLA